jgi:hypothetical protein
LKALASILSTLCVSCAYAVVPADQLAAHVSSLVAAALDAHTESAAFIALEKLGEPGVPYIVSHLRDFRVLPVKAISLENHSPQAFEGLRHYGPATVHDALSAILNQVTGQTFVFVYDGATNADRERNAAAWTTWCKAKYPAKTNVCSDGI